MKIVVTGGAGFIGSAVCRYLVRETDAHVVNVDKLTYAANLRSLQAIANSPRYTFIKADICDRDAMDGILAAHAPDIIMHLAAESHVDRSISGSDAFVRTNVLGTHCLLEAARAYWMQLPQQRAQDFRFLHVSTDEVYGSLGPMAPLAKQPPMTLVTLLGLQGRGRPFGGRLVSHLWAARHHFELLQQLWSFSLSRKADPVGDPQCARGQTAARLRRRFERARLAFCRGSCPRAAFDRPARTSRREIQRRRSQ